MTAEEQRQMSQIEQCEYLARMRLENPMEKYERERDARVVRGRWR